MRARRMPSRGRRRHDCHPHQHHARLLHLHESSTRKIAAYKKRTPNYSLVNACKFLLPLLRKAVFLMLASVPLRRHRSNCLRIANTTLRKPAHLILRNCAHPIRHRSSPIVRHETHPIRR
jgi:hypothetical protein